MPAPPRRRNLAAHLTLILGVGIPGLLTLGTPACTRNLEVEVHLLGPESPDPFVGVAEVQLWAQVSGRLLEVGAGRWDQGPIPFRGNFDPSLSRLVVFGRDPDGRIVASGASGPIDLIADPPQGPIPLYFTRVGVMSRTGARADPRQGLEAIGLADGRVLFFGGRGPDGCPVLQTEIIGVSGSAVGPRLPQGRLGPPAGRLPSGAVVLLGGEVISGCGPAEPARDAILLDPARNTARTLSTGLEVPRGASVATLDDTLVIWAGGEGSPAFSTQVMGLDPRRGEAREVGRLDGPRADAAAVFLGAGRILLAGGLSQPGGVPYSDASVFVTRRGSVLSERVRLGAGARAPAAVLSAAGGVLIAGGLDAAGEGLSTVRALTVGSETSVPLGDSSVVTSLTAAVGRARALVLGDGGLLLLPENGDPPHWVQVLPLGSAVLTDVPPGPLVGGLRADGLAVLRSPQGDLLTFNPGPAAILGPKARAGQLALDPGGAGEQGLGLIPLRPGAWRSTTLGLQGDAGPSVSARHPTEWAVVGPGDHADFEMQVDLRIAPGAQAALLFGFDGVEYDYVALEGSARVGRSPGRASSRPVSCAPVQSPGLLAPGAHTVGLVRRAEAVQLDLDGDGQPELQCEVPRSPAGRVALGVVRGQVTFDRVTVNSLF